MSEPGTVLGWHFVGETLRDGRPIPADGEWLEHDGPLSLCDSGLHMSERVIDALHYAPGNTICRVEGGGEIIRGDDKLVCRRRRILWRVDAEHILRTFARQCARDVLHLWDAPDVVHQYLETGDESIRDAAWVAARDAAWAAATDAARDAARATAWAAATDAARDAAWAAARAAQNAAWAAARDAARDAAWAAARDAARDAAWVAARDAAWAAATDAARDAAWAAARDAARDAAWVAARDAAWAAATDAARDAAWAAAADAQNAALEQLLEQVRTERGG